jgi:hypothetical protein
MKKLLAGLFTPYNSSPRRWLVVGVFVLAIAVLALSGVLP